MDRTRHTIISFTVAVGIAAVLAFAGLSGGEALIIGAVGGIIASIFLQRRNPSQSSVRGDTLDKSDLDSVHQNAAAIALYVRADATRIDDGAVEQLVERLADQLDTISTRLSAIADVNVAPVVVDDLFEPAQALVTEFLWLQSRDGVAEQDRMTALAGHDIPAAELGARQVAALLDRPGNLDLQRISQAADFSQAADGALGAPSPESWGNRQKLVEDAERLN